MDTKEEIDKFSTQYYPVDSTMRYDFATFQHSDVEDDYKEVDIPRKKRRRPKMLSQLCCRVTVCFVTIIGFFIIVLVIVLGVVRYGANKVTTNL